MAELDPMGGGLPTEADLLLEGPPPAPFDWVREGASFWLFDEEGRFAMPRIGLEAEPQSWNNRRYQANYTDADGNLLLDVGRGAMPPVLDERGQRAVIGGGPLTFRCIEPFKRWEIAYDGMAEESHVSRQIVGPSANGGGSGRKVPLKYHLKLIMAVPANVQDNSPERFFTWGKGKQRDALSVGLGWRFDQLFRGEGELEIDGKRQQIKVVGNRIKRRSIRTDGLFLRGHAWQAVVFPDGTAVGYEARPVHDDGNEPWNEAFVYKNGRMYHGKATKVPWLTRAVAKDDDVSFEVQTELGLMRIEGRTGLCTFKLSSKDIWGLHLHQGGALYRCDGQKAWGMIERSTVSDRLERG